MKTFISTMFLAVLISLPAYGADKDSGRLINKAIASGKPTLVDFGAGYCKACKKMKPILEALEKEYLGRANVIFVDVKEEEDLPEKYRVVMIPTQVFYNVQGKEVKRHMGFMDKADIVKELKAAGLK